jgi:radical SAM protein with 4Fe4S-binding SPASM domain
VLVVRPDGTLYQVAEVGAEPLAIGALAQQTMIDVLDSEAYRASLDRSERVTRLRCSDCRFRGACDSWPAHTAAVEHTDTARCHVAYRVHDYIEGYLRRTGLDAPALRGLVAKAAVSTFGISVNA